MAIPAVKDPELKRFASDKQWKLLETYWEAGSARKAAKLAKCHQSNITRAISAVLKKAARAGYAPDYDLTRQAPEGFQVQRATTLYDADGNLKMQWVRIAQDSVRAQTAAEGILEGMADEIPRSRPIKREGRDTAESAQRLNLFPVGDLHLGMYAWSEETGGEDYDLAIAEGLIMGATRSLIERSPKANTALIATLGDLFHYDSHKPVTPASGNLLDSDTRYGRVVRVGTRVVRAMIDAALESHDAVHVILEPGNHDPSTNIVLQQMFAMHYEAEPRVTIDTTPGWFHYYRHGRTLLGFHHGDKVKLKDLALVMAADRPQDWGDSEHRYWWTGHIHQDRVFDTGSCRAESTRVLPPVDAWASSMGYRSTQEMKAITYHAERGEECRLTYTAKMHAESFTQKGGILAAPRSAS